MGPILVVLLLVAIPVGVAIAGFVVALLLGHVFSTGDDGDPPPSVSGVVI